MLARLIHWPFARCFGLFLLVLVLVVVAFSPTTGWAQAQANGTAVSAMTAPVLANSNQPQTEAPSAPVEFVGMEALGERELVAGQPFRSPLVIPAADFRNDGSSPNGYRFWFGYGYVESQGGTVYLMAPAYLPMNATVNSMFVSFYDNGGASRPWVSLYRVNKDTGVAETMATAGTTTTKTSIQTPEDMTITSPLVVYPTYAYYVGAMLSNISHRLYSVRIYYTGS